MGNPWQIIYNRYTCKTCKKSAVLGHHPTMGLSYSDICPFCQKPLDIERITYEEKIKADLESPQSIVQKAKGLSAAINDLSKLLQSQD